MALFTWDDGYSVGLAVVDKQHRHLVDIINQLDAAVTEGHEESQIGELLTQLMDYTRYHFSTEEDLMRSAGNTGDHYRRHKAEHDDFVRQMTDLGASLQGTASAVARPLLDYLIKWLADHILGSDREMARALQGQPIGERDAKRAIDLANAERKLFAALRESEWRFRSLADSAPVLIWMCGKDRRRVFFNKPWSAFTGIPPNRLEAEWSACVHPEDRAAVLQRYIAGNYEPVTLEFRLRHAEGSYRWMLESALPREDGEGQCAGYVGSCVDITERKLYEQKLEQEVAERTAALREANLRLESEKAEQTRLIGRLRDAQSQLLQSEKLASIGQLAAGVAHEINNPVGYVKSNLSSLAEYVNQLLTVIDAGEHGAEAMARAKAKADLPFLREDVIKLLAESREGVDRVQHIVRDLKDFSHVDQAMWTLADLHKGLDSTINLVWNDLKYKADVVKDYGDLPPVECIARQLNQVFMNLLVNAAQAIPERGTITVRTRTDADNVVIEIADTGAGIAPDCLSRIFDPFYTTKPVGKGTGLGLSIAYGIIQRHGGHIDVDSTVGKGSTFRIHLPLRRSAAAA